MACASTAGFHQGSRQEDVLRGGQVEAQAAGLQADEEQPALRIVLKSLHVLLPVARGAVEILVVDARLCPGGCAQSPAGW